MGRTLKCTYKYYSLITALVFILSSCQKERILEVVTLDSSINQSEYKAKGVIIDLGEDKIHNHGFCLSLSAEPTLEDIVYDLGEILETGDFTTPLANLEPNNTYFIRGFAQTESYIKYGNIVSFFTYDNTLSVLTNIPSIINESTIEIEGNIENVGSLHILDYGFCWSDYDIPVINDNFNSLGELNTDIVFTSLVDNLDIHYNYYIRSYCKTGENTYVYGNIQNIFIPDLRVTTDTFTLNTNSSATLQGAIISLGINPVIEHGHCWSITNAFPDYNSNKINLGEITSEDEFYSNLSDIESGQLYYYRAYASNGDYVKYGEIKSFTPN